MNKNEIEYLEEEETKKEWTEQKTIEVWSWLFLAVFVLYFAIRILVK